MTNSSSPSPTEPGDILIYDGDCPFCSAYVRMLRLQKVLNDFRLIDARDSGWVVDLLETEGFDLDDGMVLRLNGQYFHGDDCIHRLALLSGPSDRFNRWNAWVFRSRRRARFLYPILRSGRNLALFLLGKKKFGDRSRIDQSMRLGP